MKTAIQFRCSLIFFAVIAWTGSFGKDQDQKKKHIEKNYQISSSTRLNIENKFGKVEVNNWEKDEFSVRIEIVGKGRNEERAQRILDAIAIDINQNSNDISFETEIESRKNKNQEGFEINYTVYMPEDNPLYVKNSFGDVTMGDRKGNLELNVSYGSMKIGDIEGNAQIRLSFGSGSVGNAVDGNITVKYSSMEIESANTIEFEQGFSDIEIGEVRNLELESKYGKVEIEKAHKIEADVHFSGFEIEELTGSLELDCSYLGDFRVERLAKSFTLLKIDGKFGSYDIGLEPGLNADIDAEFSFADLKHSSEVKTDFNYRVKESNKSYYKGKIGDGDPDKMIKVDSRYGNLRLSID
ncbi:MAG: hypothetical protein GDA51_12930 [Ekhidna sp.]|nr:hypothetical protein [Ekhidna sp.]